MVNIILESLYIYIVVAFWQIQDVSNSQGDLKNLVSTYLIMILMEGRVE